MKRELLSINATKQTKHKHIILLFIYRLNKLLFAKLFRYIKMLLPLGVFLQDICLLPLLPMQQVTLRLRGKKENYN